VAESSSKLTSGISRVSFYTAMPVSMCDRCSAGIKYVHVVSYRDGTTQRYGSECINKILDGDTSLRKLFDKNVKLLRKHQAALAALSMPEDKMSRGSEYFGSGLYFIADQDGRDVSTTHWFFHPLFDQEKNAAGGRYVVAEPAQHANKCRKEIEQGKEWLRSEIARIELFLARVLRKGLLVATMAGAA